MGESACFWKYAKRVVALGKTSNLAVCDPEAYLTTFAPSSSVESESPCRTRLVFLVVELAPIASALIVPFVVATSCVNRLPFSSQTLVFFVAVLFGKA